MNCGAVSNDFDGKGLNPIDVEIDLPFWAFKRLKELHLLEHNHASGRRRICACVFGFMELWEGPDFMYDREFRAFDPGYQRAFPKDRVEREILSLAQQDI